MYDIVIEHNVVKELDRDNKGKFVKGHKPFHYIEGERPNCKYCNSKEVWSHSVNWWCQVCGKQWKKIYKRETLPMMEMNDYEKGWISALLDGEGYLGLYQNHSKDSKRCKRGFKWQIKAAVSMCSYEMLVELARIIGVKKPYSKKVKKRTPDGKTPKPCWTVDITLNKLRILLPQIKLIAKEKQRILLIEALELTYQNQRNARWNNKIVDKNNVRLCQIRKEMKYLNRKGI